MTSIIGLAVIPILLVQLRGVQSIPAQLVVTGPGVVFFSPVATERDSLIKADGMELAEVFDDYDYYAGKAASFMNGRRIPVEFTTAAVIIVRLESGVSRKFERKAFPEQFGVILSDGVGQPKLIPGLLTDEEWIAEFKEYFRMK